MTDPSTIIHWANGRVENWCKFNKRQPRNVVALGQISPTKWTKPPWGFVKLNWDASVDKHMNKMGIRVLTRDHEGTVLAMFCSRKDYVIDPTMA
jgi:hypothetical protein